MKKTFRQLVANVPADVKKDVSRMMEASEKLWITMRKAGISEEQLASEANMPLEDVQDIISASAQYDPVAIERLESVLHNHIHPSSGRLKSILQWSLTIKGQVTLGQTISTNKYHWSKTIKLISERSRASYWKRVNQTPELWR